MINADGASSSCQTSEPKHNACLTCPNSYYCSTLSTCLEMLESTRARTHTKDKQLENRYARFIYKLKCTGYAFPFGQQFCRLKDFGTKTQSLWDEAISILQGSYMVTERDRHPERRQYVRHQYPLAKRPMVEIEGKAFPVLDICERGLRIQTTPSMGFVLGATVDAAIRFSGREEVSLSGRLVRQQGPYAGIFLSEAIPQEMI